MFRSFDFDSAVIVLLSAADYSVVQSSCVPCHVIEAASVYRAHVNARVLFATPEVMGHAEATDLTATLRAAQGRPQGSTQSARPLVEPGGT